MATALGVRRQGKATVVNGVQRWHVRRPTQDCGHRHYGVNDLGSELLALRLMARDADVVMLVSFESGHPDLVEFQFSRDRELAVIILLLGK